VCVLCWLLAAAGAGGWPCAKASLSRWLAAAVQWQQQQVHQQQGCFRLLVKNSMLYGSGRCLLRIRWHCIAAAVIACTDASTLTVQCRRNEAIALFAKLAVPTRIRAEASCSQWSACAVPIVHRWSVHVEFLELLGVRC
jgi:hypothetical protein